MATNLSIENLSKVIDTGDVQGSLGKVGSASERRVLQEMNLQGMEISEPGSNVSGPGAAKDFGEVLKDSFDKVNLHQHQSDRAIKELVAGRSKNIHETMLAIERADSSLKLAMQVRNKILEAYREIMRMQV